MNRENAFVILHSRGGERVYVRNKALRRTLRKADALSMKLRRQTEARREK